MRRPPASDRAARAGWPGSWIPALVLVVASALVVVPGAAGQAGVAVQAPPAAVRAEDQLTGRTYLPLLINHYGGYAASGFGVQIFSTNATLSTKLSGMGARWVRMPLSWSKIEPLNTTPENYAWSVSWERELLRLRGQGVSFILTLVDNPAWAANYPMGPVDRADPGELVEFMEAVVARYGAPPYDVKHWEFYNEPDNGVAYFAELGEVGYFGYQPQAYVDLLQVVYQPIKSVDPEAQIVFGGIAYDAFDDPWGGPFVRTFLDGVLANGGGQYFDVMNFHYYLAFAADWAPYGIDILGKYNYLRDKLASYGVSKPFICTETSMWSDAFNEGSDELQSRYVSQVFARSMSAGFRFTIWFRFLDDNQLGTHKWGLLNEYQNPKPAYRAYQTLARQLGGAAYVRTWPTAETGSSALEVYEFGLGATRIVLAWTNDEDEHLLMIRARELLLADKYGVEQVVQDGDDGLVDGRIRLPIGPSPVYLRLAE